MKILAIETSCDETAIAIAEFSGAKKKPKIRILSNIISSQIKLHARFGGVVPNLAKREHQKNLVPVLLSALEEAGLKSKIKNQKSKLQFKNKKIKEILEREQELLGHFEKIAAINTPKIDAIAVTYGPGLAPALWVGVNFAKALAYLWDKPLIPVNHMAGHLYSAFLQKSGVESYQLLVTSYPAIALLVSGGHTELVLMKGHGRLKVIGETLDDAAGEAFDKVARILGLKYPGGPAISALAEMKFKQFKPFKHLNVKLPRPMLNSKDYNFSFSGLKTAVLYLTRDLGKANTKKLRAEIAKEFQDAVVEVLVKKTIRAAKEYKVKTILLGGGVAANDSLRKRIVEEIKQALPKTSYRLPVTNLTGDNALMIALAAYFRAPTPKSYKYKKRGWRKVQANANAEL